jgi:hypothetical protein
MNNEKTRLMKDLINSIGLTPAQHNMERQRGERKIPENSRCALPSPTALTLMFSGSTQLQTEPVIPEYKARNN